MRNTFMPYRLWSLSLIVLGGWLASGVAAYASAEAPASFMRIGFCAADATIESIDAITQCTLAERPKRPAHSGVVQQLLYLKLSDQTPPHTQPSVRVMPYYLQQIDIFALRDGHWTAVMHGGAQMGGSHPSAALGGHRFELNTVMHGHEFIVAITSPSFAHLAIELDDSAGISPQELALAMHMGMLALLFLLSLLALATRPGPLFSKLAILTGLVLLNVLIGSGLFFKIWPAASIHWFGFVLFNSSVAARLACMTWVYASIIQDYNSRASYHQLNRITYGLMLLVITVFILNLPHIGWPLLGVLLAMALLTPMWGLLTAKGMPRLLQWSLIGSVALYLGLNLLALMLLIGTTGQSHMPVYITRVIDLGLPLAMLGLILVRNKVNDQALKAAQAEVLAKAAALHTEQRVSQEKKLLLDMLTHEIKNPLTSIRFAIGSLANNSQPDAPNSQRRLDNIARSVQSIDEIIERCNLANGLDEQSIEPQLETVDVTGLVQSLIDTSDHKGRFVVTLNATPTLATDRYLLKVIVANLLDNALKYATPGTPVRVATHHTPSATGGTVKIQVRNTVPEHIELKPNQLFERYYRHESAQHIRGSGLGLALSHDIAQLIGARLTCATDANHIEFEVTFDLP